MCPGGKTGTAWFLQSGYKIRWMLAGSWYKVAKVLIISPGIVILLTAVVRWVLSSVDYLSVRAGVVFAKTMTSLLIIPSVLYLGQR